MRPHLESWAILINACREMSIPIIYTTPVSRADGADVVMLPTHTDRAIQVVNDAGVVVGHAYLGRLDGRRAIELTRIDG